MTPRRLLIGQVFGRLTVRAFSGRDKRHNDRWLCLCECGREPIVRGHHLRSGHTVSCGCWSRDRSIIHGASKTRLYRIWGGFRDRCQNLHSHKYSDYGRRGIVICDEWKSSFAAFKTWAMSNGYADHLSLDRINNDGNYEPGNCRWTTMVQQNRNRRDTKLNEKAVREIRADQRRQREIALDYGISQSHVSSIKRRRCWPDDVSP